MTDEELKYTEAYIEKFSEFEAKYESFIIWCMTIRCQTDREDFERKKADEFYRRGLDKFFKTT